MDALYHINTPVSLVAVLQPNAKRANITEAEERRGGGVEGRADDNGDVEHGKPRRVSRGKGGKTHVSATVKLSFHV